MILKLLIIRSDQAVSKINMQRAKLINNSNSKMGNKCSCLRNIETCKVLFNCHNCGKPATLTCKSNKHLISDFRGHYCLCYIDPDICRGEYMHYCVYDTAKICIGD